MWCEKSVGLVSVYLWLFVKSTGHTAEDTLIRVETGYNVQAETVNLINDIKCVWSQWPSLMNVTAINDHVYFSFSVVQRRHNTVLWGSESRPSVSLFSKALFLASFLSGDAVNRSKHFNHDDKEPQDVSQPKGKPTTTLFNRYLHACMALGEPDFTLSIPNV